MCSSTYPREPPRGQMVCTILASMPYASVGPELCVVTLRPLQHPLAGRAGKIDLGQTSSPGLPSQVPPDLTPCAKTAMRGGSGNGRFQPYTSCEALQKMHWPQISVLAPPAEVDIWPGGLKQGRRQGACQRQLPPPPASNRRKRWAAGCTPAFPGGPSFARAPRRRTSASIQADSPS